MARKGIPVLDFDDLITAIQALSAPSATNVAVDTTDMEIITSPNTQGALKQLDTAVDEINASLTNKVSKSGDTMSWSLSASNDKENWIELDSQEDYDTTTSRQVVAYSKQLENTDGAIGIIAKYVKIENTWVAF